MTKTIKLKNKSRITIKGKEYKLKGFDQLRDEKELRKIFKEANKRIRREKREMKKIKIKTCELCKRKIKKESYKLDDLEVCEDCYYNDCNIVEKEVKE